MKTVKETWQKAFQLGNVEKYFSMQKRFKGVTQEEMEEVSRHLVERYEYLKVGGT
ncbi:MAG: hypothetical protein ACLUOI_32310 [Eisenbergiella sp.]